MLKTFEVCFYTGVIFTAASFILSHISDITHIGGHVDTGGHLDAGHDGAGDFHAGHADTAVHIDAHSDSNVQIHTGGTHFFTVSPLKPITLASFVTVFGGVGMICLKNGLAVNMAVIAAVVSALAVSSLLYRFIVVPLYMAQNTSAVSQTELLGSIAKTTLAISGGSFGRIKYEVNGNTYSAPAKSVNGEDINRGVNVVIIDIKKNIFYVKEIRGGI